MNKNVKKNIQAYDSTVEQYFENTKSIEEPEIQQRKEFLSLIPKKGKILDLGCGPGRDAKMFSDQDYQVVGVDLSKKTIEKAKIVAPKAEFRVMDFLNLDFEESSFDAVWFNAGLLCIEKKFALDILKSIHKLLRDKGILFASVKEGEGEGFKIDKRYSVKKYHAYFMEEEILNLLNTANFKKIKTFKPNLKSNYHTHQWIGILCQKT
ncbi:MAG: class I SAM-dependent methyltransferase [Patescibacteria group bacterium]|nr:class I SAM-dependent methyltransferase [Patescibacteria group bacterium]